jgi:hypothetical protein
MLKTYQGSCHCGAVRFECDLDLEQGTSRCNCSICTKQRFWKAIARSGAFRLLQGQEAVANYEFGKGAIRHTFCSRCGVKTFGRGHHEALGGEFHGINVACLDDLTPQDLGRLRIQYEDGMHDAWERAPQQSSYL